MGEVAQLGDNDASASSVLAAEQLLASAALIRRRGAGLGELGVPWERLANRALVGVQCGEISRGDYFEPAPEDDAPLHIVIPCIEHGAVLDLVAFRPDRPGHWGLRTGIGSLLGHAEFARAQEGQAWGERSGLILHRSPLEWLRAGAAGICVIDGFQRDTIAQLRELARIEVHDARFARRLRLELSRPERIPEIVAIPRARRCPA